MARTYALTDDMGMVFGVAVLDSAPPIESGITLTDIEQYIESNAVELNTEGLDIDGEYTVLDQV